MAKLAENTKMARGLAALPAVVVFAAALSASAATRTWTGGGDGSTWADARNWGGTAPAAGDDVVVSATSVNDLGSAGSPLALHSLTLSGAVTISGNPILIANGGLLRSSSASTAVISAPLVMGTALTPAVTNSVAASGTLELTGVVSGPANIWVERPLIALRPTQMDNIYIFSLRADSTFRPGDSFLWHFRSRYVLQGNNREAFAQLVVHYENDSVEGKSQFIRADAETEVRVDPAKNKDSLQIRSLSGYVYLPISTQDPKVFRLLTLTDIALVRFHKVVPPEKTELAVDSLTLDSLEKDTSAISSQPHQRLTPQQMRDAQPRERTINVVKEKAVNPNLRPTRRRNINQPRSNRRRTSP